MGHVRSSLRTAGKFFHCSVLLSVYRSSLLFAPLYPVVWYHLLKHLVLPGGTVEMARKDKNRRSNSKLHCAINLAAIPESQMEAIFQKKGSIYSLLLLHMKEK